MECSQCAFVNACKIRGVTPDHKDCQPISKGKDTMFNPSEMWTMQGQ